MIFIVVIDFTHSEARPAKAAVPQSAGGAEEKAAFSAGVGAQAAVDSERQRREGRPAVPESPGFGASVEESAPSSTPGISEAKAAFAQSSGVA